RPGGARRPAATAGHRTDLPNDRAARAGPVDRAGISPRVERPGVARRWKPVSMHRPSPRSSIGSIRVPPLVGAISDSAHDGPERQVRTPKDHPKVGPESEGFE